ncbi:MAG TPA: HD domain-containing protein [Candidatus Marinimicrobia bacterium]|jgi:tRNA nucleotidyltransferase/poly(A) polymerase|nr:HD domain-containing protein [Candidatus Neomarinimicrobiota bacterium]|tara:strand:+ start:894 stop:2309 length:1416 start_codon:yes stop_codon:yes gene_type:complete
MANIRHLIEENIIGSNILQLAGELGAKYEQEVYVVGGYVRDLFLERDIKEIDFMVVGDGIKFSRLLADELKVDKIVPFQRFSTARIPYKKIPLEVASARTESYDNSSRKPNKIQYTDLKGDLLRRDFTINAMAIDLHPKRFGNLSDPFKGILDLQAKKLVTPLDPNKTFSDDPLRMMRAAYFCSKLDMRVDSRIRESMNHQAARIKIVSAERITAEFLKILSCSKPSTGLKLLQHTGLMKHVFPEIDAMWGLEQTSEWHHKDIFAHTLQVVDNAADLTDVMRVRFAALVHDIAKPKTRRIHKKKGYTFYGHDFFGSKIIQKVAKRMKLPNELNTYLQKMTALHLRPIAIAKEKVTDSAVRRLMVAAGEDIHELMLLCRADITTKNPRLVKKYMGNFERVEERMQNVKELDEMTAFQSPVRGKEIMLMFGIKPGKKVGEIKLVIEEAILNGEIENNYDDAKEFLLKNKKLFF